MSKHSMTLRYPATRWQDACPTGSGIVGAMLYGAVAHDTLLLNHDALYYPKERAPIVDMADQLPVLRNLLDAGAYTEAAELYAKVYSERTQVDGGSTSTQRDPYQPFCALRLDSETDGPFKNYRRGVDFETGRAWMTYADAKATYTREAFVSRVTDTVWFRVRADQPGTISCKVSLGRVDNEQVNTRGFAGSGDLALPDFEELALPNRMLVFSGAYNDTYAFTALAQIDTKSGATRKDGNEWIIEGADEVVIQVRLALDTSRAATGVQLMRSFVDSPGYWTAFSAHVAQHSALFNRLILDLGDDDARSNEELLLDAYDGDVPTALVQALFEYGRYLLICSSRAGGWPANLQGLWNGDYSPAWNSDIHNDENIQMNYWQALPGALPETMQPFFEYFESMLPDYRDNAQKLFGCRGIYVPIAQTTHGLEYPGLWSSWTAAAGWLGQHFYDYYLFTGDEDFLRDRALPWLKEVALFYQDFLIEGDDGKLLITPSLSPENVPSGEGMSLLTMNATMDVAVCREVLTSLIHACVTLDMEQESVPVWQAMLVKLPDYAVNVDGAMREWLHPRFVDNYHHRHQSHIYPLFPGMEVTAETQPELFDACRVAVEKRLVIGLESQSGWSMAHMADIYARLGMGNRALECMEILTRSSVGPNLFTYHNDWRQMGLSLYWRDGLPPFQIDANFGITAAVLEMLVFSKPGMVKLLPALPDAWFTGSVTGIACRGGLTVDMAWDRDAGTFEATLAGTRMERVLLKLPDWVGTVAFSPEDCVLPAPEFGEDYGWVMAGSSVVTVRG